MGKRNDAYCINSKKNLEPVDINSFISKVDAGKASCIKHFNNVADTICLKARLGYISVVFGAANFHKLTKLIIEYLKNTKF